MRVVLLLLAASAVLTYSKINRLIVDGDTFWAIKTGEWISANGTVPRYDTFSWTAAGNPWVAHEWLYDFLLYKLYDAFGFYGIVLFVFAAVFASLYFLWQLYRGGSGNVVLAVVVFAIVLFMLKPAFSARPHIYSYVFFIYFLYVLFHNRGLFWTLPPVTVLWANMHGSVVLGIAMVFLHLVYWHIYNYASGKKLQPDVSLLLAALLVPLASLVNPYGAGLWKAAYLQITHEMNRQIVEWQPPDFGDPAWVFIYVLMVALVVALSLARKGEIEDKGKIYLMAIYLLGTFWQAMSGIRYFPYLAVCWGMFVLALLPGELFSKRGWDKKVVILVILIALVVVVDAGKPPASLDEVMANDNKEWPVMAFDYLDDKKTFNDYTWGGYLVLRDFPVFIDGRADVYWKGSDVFEDYLKATRIKVDPLEIMDKYSVEQALIPSGSSLDIYLKRAGWTEKYRDDTSVIFLRQP